MEQFQQIGEVLGSLKALMLFRDEIRINQRQCCLLFDLFNLGFKAIAEEIKQNLQFDEKFTKWKTLKRPLKELHMIFREGEQFITQCMETKDWWTKAISQSQNTDCVEFHIHNLLWCVPVVIDAIEIAGEFSGSSPEEMQRKRIMSSKKYEKEWVDSILFQRKFGKQYLVSQDIHNRLNTVWREDRLALMEMIGEKRISGSAVLMKQEHRVAELLLKSLSRVEPSKGKLFPSSILVGSKDYQVRRRLGSGSQYKEIQWMGVSFVVRHIFGEIEPLIPEISLLSSLFHSNIVQFLCGFSDEVKKECYLVMELMNKDLGNYIKEICSPRKRVPFSLPVAVDIMLQIGRGMEYLHSREVYHGDLNPSNILVRTRNSSAEGYLHVKVSGFGLSSFKNFTRSSSDQTRTKPCIWYAPEVLSEQEQPSNSCKSKSSEKADVYSFGMICFELLTGKVPFEEGHLQGDQMGRNIRAGERPLFPFPSPKYLTNLTKKCWHSDPIQRPSFSSICRILRYIKRFLVMNPDHSQSDPPLVPLIDYCDLEMSLSKRFDKSVSTETTAVTQIPFQMFAYRVAEKEKTNLSLKEKSSESGSEGASVCEDDPVVIAEDTLSSTPIIEKKSQASLEKKKASAKKSVDAKVNRNSGRLHKGKPVRPSELMTCGHSLRANAKSQLDPIELSPRRWTASGHASDSEIA